MSPLTPEQQLSHAWREELPGVTLYQERDITTFEVRLYAEAHISSTLHRLTEEVLMRSNGEAAEQVAQQVAAEMRDKALDAFGLHSVIQKMRHEEAMKYEAVAAQLDVQRAAAEEARDASRASGDEPGTINAAAEASTLRRAAAAIRAAHAQPTRGT